MVDNEWTCYRRNYFQVSGTFGFSHTTKMPTPMNDLSLIMDDHQQGVAVGGFGGGGGEIDGEHCLIECAGRQRPILRYKMGVLARVAASEKEITLVQHTTKRDKGPQESPAPKPVTMSRVHPQNMNNLPGMTTTTSGMVDYISNEVVTYERLQFKAATANNGKRRAAQQYFCVDLVLYAEVPGDLAGTVLLVKLAVSSSCSLVVRGRSPGHYTDGGLPSASATSPYPLLSPGIGAGYASAGGFDPLSMAPTSAYGALGNLSHILLNNSPFGDGSSSLDLPTPFGQELPSHHFPQQTTTFPFGDVASQQAVLLSSSPSSFATSQNGFDSMIMPSMGALAGYDQSQNSFIDQAAPAATPNKRMLHHEHFEDFQNDPASTTLMAFPQPMLAPNSMASSLASLRSDESIESAFHLS